ncbi:hypothetical protein [Pseudoalteromonas phage J2-1_QLiu-2017]|nr:hypothetical protein [Pseudoalteromonas phage J2-1_QLiu-2017]
MKTTLEKLIEAGTIRYIIREYIFGTLVGNETRANNAMVSLEGLLMALDEYKGYNEFYIENADKDRYSINVYAGDATFQAQLIFVLDDFGYKVIGRKTIIDEQENKQ